MKKKIFKWTIPLCSLFFSAAVCAEVVETKTQQGNVITTTVQGVGSDSLAIGDPLGNGAVTAKHDAGPPMTRAPYPEECNEDRCLRAKKRHYSNTTWQQDRATGLSLGWGGSGGSSSGETSKAVSY